MRQTTNAREFASFIKQHLGFDPADAVAAGLRRGWVKLPERPISPALPDVGAENLIGTDEAAEFLRISQVKVRKLVAAGRITCRDVDGYEVYSLAELTALKRGFSVHQARVYAKPVREAVIGALRRMGGAQFTVRTVMAFTSLSKCAAGSMVTTLRHEGVIRLERACMGPKEPAVYRMIEQEVAA